MRKKVAENSSAVWSLRLCGLWYPEKKNILLYNMYSWYSRIYFLMYVVHVSSMVTHVCLTCRDVESFAASTYVLSIKVIAVYKRIYISAGISLARKLIYILDDDQFQPKDANQEKIEKKLFNSWRITANTLLFGVFNTVLFLILSPFIDGISKMRLPFGAWYPFQQENQGVVTYTILYAFQSLGTMFAGCTNVGTDVFISQILNNISMQCNLMSDTAENLYEFSAKDLDMSEPTREQILKNMNRTLISCIKQHKAILE